MMHVYLPYSDFNWFPFASLDRCCLPCNWQVWRSRNFGRRSERCMRRCEADRSITWRLLLLLLLLVELQFFQFVQAHSERHGVFPSIQYFKTSAFWYKNGTTFYAQGPAAPAVGMRGFDPRLGTKAAKAWYGIYNLQYIFYTSLG